MYLQTCSENSDQPVHPCSGSQSDQSSRWFWDRQRSMDSTSQTAYANLSKSMLGAHVWSYIFLWLTLSLSLFHWCGTSELQRSVLGLVVQSVVSLTSLLRVISLTVLANSIYNILIFFAEKMWVAFALQKLLTFFQQNISAYLRITRCKF